MVKLIVILLQFLLATSEVLTENVQSGHELKYIGSFKSKSSVQGRNNEVFDESNYYISPNAASWETAELDCRNQLGPIGTLLAIESEEEWEFIEKILQYYGFGTTYWTSGRYDTRKTLWKWAVNGQSLPPFAPWGPHYPSTPNALLRVLLHYISPYDAHWRTVPSTQLHRYICEEQVPTIAVPCYETNDLAIVLDSSRSIGYEDFEKVKVFVERLASAFTVHSASRLSFITYSHYANVIIEITNTYSRGEISSTILSTPWEAGSTYTNLGILSAISQLANQPQHVPMNIVVLTDGESTQPDLTIQVADVAKSMGIRTFSVGLSEYINERELVAIAGNDASRVFSTKNFDELINLLAPVSVKICEQ